MGFIGPEPGHGIFGFLKRQKSPGSVIGLREVATMWHLPTREDASSDMDKAYEYGIAPPLELVADKGAYVGDATVGPPRRILLPDDFFRRSQLVIGSPDMGQQIFIEHCVAHKLERKDRGENEEAIIVIAPHSGLINALLALTPPGLKDRVWLIDLADEEHVPGINLLDTHVFGDRDHTCGGVIRVVRGNWQTWGGRMQNLLEHTVKSLHEANAHGDTARGEQHTLLDAIRMLNDGEFRAKILGKVDDIFLARFWRDKFDKWPARQRAEAVAPVQTRLDYFTSSKRAREIFGQRQCTLDIKAAIERGDVIYINTGVEAVGRDVASLVGAGILNLVDAAIRQQRQNPGDERGAAYIVVDEMHTIPGVNFPGMLTEVHKVGGSVCLLTDSLSSLDGVSKTLTDQVLSGASQFVAFQTSGADAKRLVGELGRRRVSVDDITSLPANHAYVRVMVEGKRPPAFSMKLRDPQERNPSWARAIRARCGEYTRSAAEVEAQLAGEYELPKDAPPDSSAGYTGVDGGVPYVDFGNLSRPREGDGRARGRRRGSRTDASGSGRDADRRDASQGGDDGERGSGRRRPKSARDSNIRRFEDNP